MTNFRLFQTKVFADDNVKSDENSVFKRLALQTHRNQGLFGKGLKKTHNIAIHVYNSHYQHQMQIQSR